ncbi:hypothetical protein CCP1ISM_190004 [Azospirillaceae bacterium]
MERQSDITAAILARLAQHDAQFERLESLIRQLLPTTGTVALSEAGAGAVSPMAPSSPANDPDDPFVPPDWIKDPLTGVYTYTVEPECCSRCGRRFYPENHWVWWNNPGDTIKSFKKNGSTPPTYKDIGPREIKVRRKAYRCGVHDCFRTTAQPFPDIFHEHHRMTKRLYLKIITELRQPYNKYGKIADIARMAGVSRKTIDRIRDEIEC